MRNYSDSLAASRGETVGGGRRVKGRRPRHHGSRGGAVALTITLIMVGTVIFAVLELWLFWSLGEHVDRRRLRPGCASPDSGEVQAKHPQRRSPSGRWQPFRPITSRSRACRGALRGHGATI